MSYYDSASREIYARGNQDSELRSSSQ